MLFATGRSIEGPTEETIDFLREEGVDIGGDGDDEVGGRGERGGGEAAGVGRVTRTGSRVVAYNSWPFRETGKRATARTQPTN